MTVAYMVVMMSLMGMLCTLLLKFQDAQCVRNCDSPDPKVRKHFEQPVLQTVQMFIGQMSCWLIIGARSLHRRMHDHQHASLPHQHSETDQLLTDDENVDGETSPSASLALTIDIQKHLDGWKISYLAMPACCDVAATTLTNMGLLAVTPSIYQMLSGLLVLFVGLFSVMFLQVHLDVHKWTALVIVVAGVVLVGLAGSTVQNGRPAVPVPSPTGKSLEGPQRELDTSIQIVICVSLIIISQAFTALQLVLEEKLLKRYSIEPLRAVAWEGVWGALLTFTGIVVLFVVYGRTEAGRFGYFDMAEGLRESLYYPVITWSSLLFMISIGGLNFFGLSITRALSATSRSTITACGMLFMWIISLSLGWETFKWLQMIGFTLLASGTFLFNSAGPQT